MRHLIFFTVFTFLAAGLHGQIRESAAVDSVFAEWNKPGVPGCSLGIIKDGKLIYARGYGMANLEYDIPNNERTVFRIASTSKQFTAACIMLLVRQGKLSLDDTLDKFFPDFPGYAKRITIRHLLNHTSGIRDYIVLASLKGLSDDDYYKDSDVMNWLTRQENLNFMPGEEYLYSNSGYWLLGQIVNRVAGENMADFARKQIFEPLGMSQTHFHNDHTSIVKNRASGYVPAGNSGFRISMTTLDMIGDGGIYTSIEDIKKWDDAFYDSDILDEEFWSMMTRQGILNNGDTINYASGLQIGSHKGLKTISHGGAFVGFRASLVRFPGQHFSVALLANRGDANMDKVYQVADIFLHDQYPLEMQHEKDIENEIVAAAEETEFTMEQMTGNYEVEPGIVLNVSVEADSLHIAQTWNDASYNVIRITGNTFQVPDFPALSFIFSDLKEDYAGILTVDFSGDKTICKRKKDVNTSEINPEEYAGCYYSNELEVTYTLFVENGVLEARVRNNDSVALRADDTDQFTSRTLLYRFTRENDRITGFELDAGRVNHIRFLKQ